MVQYVKILDTQNKKDPKEENIAKELEHEIEKIEHEKGVIFKSSCFLGIEDVPMDGEDELFSYCVEHDKIYKFLLFFD